MRSLCYIKSVSINLEELGMVTMTRQVGNAKLYQINKDDMVVKRLIKFLNELNLRLAEKEAVRQEMPALRKGK
jgi:hypothetical protein